MQTISRVGKRLSSERRAKILRAYARSQLTQKQFADQVGIGVSTLQAWLRKTAINPGGGGAGFLPMPNLLSASPPTLAYRIQWPGGLSLEVRSGFVDQELAVLLEALQTV